MLAEAQGISPLKIAAFKRRVQGLQQSLQTENSSVTKEMTDVPVVENYGLKKSEKSHKKEEEVLSIPDISWPQKSNYMKANLQEIRKYRRYIDEFKKEIVSFFESGKLRVLQIIKLYGIRDVSVY